MFYCNKCAATKGYPITKDRSYGQCDVCGDLVECNDRPDLQIKRPVHIPMKEIIINTEK